MTLVDRQRIARGTMTFWFDTNGSDYDFRAGQHADFAFLHPSVGDESDNLRTFSLAQGLCQASGVSCRWHRHYAGPQHSGLGHAGTAAPQAIFVLFEPRGGG